jgi:chromosomal replication initiation ATPase DnaA
LGGQLRLKLEHNADFSRDRFIVSSPNREAAETLDVWPNRRSGTLALIGSPGAGKSHLAAAWAERTGAKIVTLADLAEDELGDLSGPMLLDGADAAPHGEAFFHLLNKAQQPESCLLVTGRTPPRTWAVDLPDLRSRLNALTVVALGEPDDAILRGLLLKLFEERHIRPTQDLLAYLLLRMERSAPAAQAIVAALDETASAEHRPISRVLARELLKDETDEILEQG